MERDTLFHSVCLRHRCSLLIKKKEKRFVKTFSRRRCSIYRQLFPQLRLKSQQWAPTTIICRTINHFIAFQIDILAGIRPKSACEMAFLWELGGYKVYIIQGSRAVPKMNVRPKENVNKISQKMSCWQIERLSSFRAFIELFIARKKNIIDMKNNKK